LEISLTMLIENVPKCKRRWRPSARSRGGPGANQPDLQDGDSGEPLETVSFTSHRQGKMTGLRAKMGDSGSPCLQECLVAGGGSPEPEFGTHRVPPQGAKHEKIR
jgi:hypothetical protein